MDQTLSALGDILLKALPTFALVLLLYVYLSKVFFGPLGVVLDARRDATEGTRRQAEEMIRQAEQKTADYEAKLAAARAVLGREQQAERQKALEARAARVGAAREQAKGRLGEERERLEAEMAAVRPSLGLQSEALADQIIRAVLEKGAAG